MKLTLPLLVAILSQTVYGESAAKAAPKCKDVKLQIEATAQNWDLPAYPDATDLTTLINYVTQTIPASGFAKKPRKAVSGTYNIAATFCEPTTKVPEREKSVQFLLHGFGSSKAYWHGMNYPNATFVGEYSWVSHATSQGYSTLSIDNLGSGESDKLDPITVVQFPLQSQILLNIIRGLRAGNLASCIRSKFDKVVMVTHSYGSIHGRELTIAHPADAADAYILTATAANLIGISTLVQHATAGSAKTYDPKRLGGLPTAYMSFKDSGLKDILYPVDGDFDSNLLAWDQTFPHTYTVGELVSPKQNITSNFTGPVMVLTGREDPIVCDAQGNNTAHLADCGAGKDTTPGRTALVFPKAQFGLYIPDRTGHNTNFGYSAPETFGAAHSFLEVNGF